jgi:protocatechuate 3,4-dioxygenase beta subunit
MKPGRPPHPTFKVSRMCEATCAPLPGAQVDVWHCDATGRYSGCKRQLLVDAVPGGRGYAAAFDIASV